MKRIKLLTLFLLLAIIIAACSDSSEEPPTPAEAPADMPAVEQPAADVPAEEPPVVEPSPPLESIEFVLDPNLVDVTWAWVQRTSAEGTEVLLTVPNPEQYTLLFNADASFSAKLDCNNGSGGYSTDGAGNILMQLGPMTAAACPPESLSNDMMQMFGPAQSYVYEENGNVVIFKWVAGGPWDYYRKAGTSASAPESPGAAESAVVGTTWQWEEFHETDGSGHANPNAEAYTLTLLPDGTASIQADCNQVQWTYTMEGDASGTLSFDTFGPSTLAFCPEPSLSELYLGLLGNVATYVLDGGRLNLNLQADGGNMVFGAVEKGDAEDVKSDFPLSPDQITLDTKALGTSWQAVVVEETPYDESMPPGPVGLPTHIEVLFGATDPAQVQPGDPIMYIIPVNTYRKMWDEASNDTVTRTIQEIQQLNFVLPSPAPTSGYPVLPYEQAVGYNDLAVQVGRAISQAELNTTSATQDGYRFVGRWAQDANPVTNQGLRYVYQGFTNDGVYLVSFWYPATTSALPNEVGEVPAEQMDQFNADPTAYIDAVAEQLNALSTDQWDPDLATLDAVVASLQIEGMTPSGLLDKTWEWTKGPSQPGSSEIIDVPDPAKYQVTYGSDGIINYVADCNVGSMPFVLNIAGMTGDMLAEFGPMTLAECGPESLSTAFASSLQASQSYRVWAGGNEMELVLPAGGGVLLFRAAGAPEPEGEQACVSGTITYQQRIALPEDAVVQVQIQDPSLADAPAEVIGEQIITSPGQAPIAYEVCYDPNVIQDGHTYTMSARITDAAGNLLWINDTSIPVITNDNPATEVEIPVIQVNAPEQACVSGTITYQQRIALPEDAVVQVQIQDTSLADAPAEVIGEQVINSPGQVPIAYEVCYDPSLIQENHTYTMSARITDAAGNLLWINDTSIPVITNGNPTTDVEIPVIQVGG